MGAAMSQRGFVDVIAPDHRGKPHRPPPSLPAQQRRASGMGIRPSFYMLELGAGVAHMFAHARAPVIP